MNLRIAKKVLQDPDSYSGQQRYDAAHRLYRRAVVARDGQLGFDALRLKPQRSFHLDDQLDLRYEYFLARFDKLEYIDFPRGEIIITAEEMRKPARRRDGQCHNFNALPFPGSVSYKQKTVVHKSKENGVEVEDTFVINEAVAGPTTKVWEMGEWRTDRPYSRKKYQIREAKVAGTAPPRLKRPGLQVRVKPWNA